MPIARTLGNCLSIELYSRLVDLFGPSRLKELLFTARLLSAEEARAAGFVHEIVEPAAIDARVRALAQEIAGYARSRSASARKPSVGSRSIAAWRVAKT